MSEERVSLSAPPPAAPQPQDFAVPTELVPLPSQGRVYPPGHPLAGQEAIEICAMTAHDEDILTSRALIKSGKVISSLLRSCIADKGVDPETMLVGDRNATLIGIRINGYGADYPVKVECPVCSAETSLTVDLNTLPIRRFPADLRVEASTNEFKFDLPASKKRASFKLFTGSEERELLQLLDRGRRQNIAEELVTNRLRLQVTSIGDERDPTRLASLIRRLPARDSRELRQYIDRVTPGVELKAAFECGTCGHAGDAEVPLGTDFFWPGP
jgi:hypothetical protein